MEPAPVQQKPGEILVFFVRGDTKCAECGADLFSGMMITLEKDRGALCLSCADLDHLQFLASGDAAVTRRATKHSKLRAVVLQWSRSRKRYERQGILVETEAIEKAETECLADGERRKRQSERRALRAAEIDQVYGLRYPAAQRNRTICGSIARTRQCREEIAGMGHAQRVEDSREKGPRRDANKNLTPRPARNASRSDAGGRKGVKGRGTADQHGFTQIGRLEAAFSLPMRFLCFLRLFKVSGRDCFFPR